MARSQRRVRAARAGTLRLLLVFATLLGVNVYIFFLRGGTSIGALLRSTRIKPGAVNAGPVLEKHSTPAAKITLVEDPLGADVTELVLADGQTIAQALTPRLGKKRAVALETALGADLDLASVRAGQTLTLIHDADDRPVALEFRASPQLAYRLDLVARKTTPSRLEGKLEVRTAEVTVPAGPALWEGLHRAGESAALGERIADLFCGDEWLPSASTAERVRVVVEKHYIQGRFQRYGRILGADWVSHSGLRRAFAFGDVAYTDRGEAVARRYLVSPLRAGRGIASHRGLRDKSDARYTVEWTVPKDSVVRAVADGTVTALTRGPTGASVTIDVAPGERIVYSHVLRPSRLVALGAPVSQGLALGRTDGGVTLAYEGKAAATARAYEEARIPSARLAPIDVSERPRFGEIIAPTLERLRAIALRASDPLAARALGAIP